MVNNATHFVTEILFPDGMATTKIEIRKDLVPTMNDVHINAHHPHTDSVYVIL